MIDRVRERKVRHRQRGKLYRATFASGGFIVILIGLLLIPLPGPGWLIVALGIGMLALEFDRAERLLERLLNRLDQARDEAANASPARKVLYALILAAGLAAAVAAVVLWDIPFLPG